LPVVIKIEIVLPPGRAEAANAAFMLRVASTSHLEDARMTDFLARCQQYFV
jgi:hypothetical protein